MTSQRIFFAVPIVFILLLSGCTSSRMREARNAFIQDGDPQAAVEILENHKESSERLSMLLFYMEKGLLEHQAGRLEESIATFRKASDLMKSQDYLSVSQQTASILTNDWMTDYKGEYCERLWVHTYLMINYILLHQYEGALVEAKQAQKVFDAYPDALTEAYFSMALVGFCYELLREYNDATIVYQKLAKRMPDPSPICDALVRTGRLSGIGDSTMCQKGPEEKNERRTPSEMGELVLFVGTGFAPVKVPGNIILPPGIRFSFPRYERNTGSDRTIAIHREDGQRLPHISVSTDLMQVASASLGERAKRIYIKETARVAAKEVIIYQARQEDAIVGVMTRMAMMALEEPDTRSWQTLPGRNSLVRIYLEPGSYRLTAVLDGAEPETTVILPFFTIQKGERRFFAIREYGRFATVQGQKDLENRLD